MWFDLWYIVLIFQEAQIKALEAEIKALQNPDFQTEEITPELEKLRSENTKLKYQALHLTKVCKDFVLFIIEIIFLSHVLSTRWRNYDQMLCSRD